MKHVRNIIAGVVCVVGAVAWLAIGSQAPVRAQSGVSGASPFHLVALNSNNCQKIIAGAHSVFSAQLSGIGSAPAYLKFYDKTTAPVAGTDTPIKVLMIPAASTAANGAGSNVLIPFGAQFSSGLGICVTAGIADNDNTSVAAATYVINFDYQ